MRISIGSDHGGYLYKEELISYLQELGHDVIDCGTYSLDSCDYPDFAYDCAKLVSENKVDRGIVVCTSGEGVCITANKVKGVRCGLCYNDEVSKLIRLHNNCNMIAFGAKFFPLEDIKRWTKNFLETEFEGGRHQNRVNKIER